VQGPGHGLCEDGSSGSRSKLAHLVRPSPRAPDDGWHRGMILGERPCQGAAQAGPAGASLPKSPGCGSSGP
jgi:hypothetical protein